MLIIPQQVPAQTEHPEVSRTRGFKEYKKQRKLVEGEREKGLSLHLEKVEMEKREYEESLNEYRKEKRKDKPLEYTEAYQENLTERQKEKRRQEQALEDFKYDRKVEKRQLEQAHLNKMEELGLPEDRPRYDLKKRILFGAAPKFGKSNQLGGSSSGGSSGGDTNYSPPPQSFDEFPAPPPSFPGEDNFDLPPPPPMPFDDGSGMNNAPFDEFPPPPPQPMPDDFNF